MSKKDIVKYIIDEYGVTSPTDITNALKDLLGETLQEMVDVEFNAHMGYEKQIKVVIKQSIEMGHLSKNI